MCFFAFLVLLCAAVMSFNHPRINRTVLPKQDYSVFIINVVSALIALALTFKPSVWQAQVSLLFIQAVTTTLTGYNTHVLWTKSSVFVKEEALYIRLRKFTEDRQEPGITVLWV